jgi:hypothetical protein
MTTIHAGDCLNGCAVCAVNYHEGQGVSVCLDCGLDLDEQRERARVIAYKESYLARGGK